MNSRERFLMAMDRKVPDRVPVTLYGGFTPKVMEVFRKKTGCNDPSEYFNYDVRGLEETKFPEDKKIDFSKLDYSVYYPQLPLGAKIQGNGVAQILGSMSQYTRMIHPMEDFKSARQVEEYPYFKAVQTERQIRSWQWEVDFLSKTVERIHQRGYAVYASGGSIFEEAWSYRGMENLLMDFILNKDLAKCLLDKITDICCCHASARAAAGVDVILLGDDVATQRSLLMNRSMWIDWLKLRLARVIESIRRVNSKTHIFYHSDGNVEEIIPDLIEIGVTILNPIQPECMDPVKIKKKYGDKLSFWGTIGTQTTFPFAGAEDIKRIVKERIETVGKGGGFLIAPTHTIEPDVPWENIIAFFEAVEEFGKY